MVISKKTITLYFQVGRSNFFQGGPNAISIETHISCDNPGGGVRTPYPPLDPHLQLL